MTSPSSNSPETAEAGLAAEPLRALRRGLTRADGFALFVAVVKTPAQRNQLITLLGEAMPTVKLQTVTIRAQSTDILDEIQNQLGKNISGPVMVVGLEDALPSDSKNHPILNALNLRRPDWPQLVPQAVVFWMPEYVLGVLGRSAPDFLDWRSDTLHFPDLEPAQLRMLQSATWDGGLDTRMSAHARLERIKELESRIATNEHARDHVIRLNVSAWLNELGLHLMLIGKNQEALDCFHKELSIFRDLGDRRGESVALGNLGAVYSGFGDSRKAIEFHTQALAIDRAIGNQRGESSALGNLGVAYQDLGDAHEAVKFLEQHLKIAREIGDQRGEANALANLGNAYDELGDAHKAIEFYEQALKIKRKAGDRRGEGSTLGNLGNVYRNLGDIRKAIDFHEQQLKIASEIGDQRGVSSALGNLGVAYGNLGDIRKAIDFFEQASAIARKIGDRRNESNSLWNSALTFDRLGDRTQAIARAEAALKIFEAIENPFAIQVREQLGIWREQSKKGPNSLSS